MTFYVLRSSTRFLSFREMEAYTSTHVQFTDLIAHSLTHLSAESSCIPLKLQK